MSKTTERILYAIERDAPNVGVEYYKESRGGVEVFTRKIEDASLYEFEREIFEPGQRNRKVREFTTVMLWIE